MGVTRADDLPEVRLARTLIEAREDAGEVKGATQIQGGASLTYVLSESEAQFDWSGRINGASEFSGFGRAIFQALLTSENAEFALMDIAMTLYVSSDGVNWVEYSQERSVSDSVSHTAPELTYLVGWLTDFEPVPFETKFGISTDARFNSWVAIKLQAIGTDDVTITVTRTY